jgi:hypothetical protein
VLPGASGASGTTDCWPVAAAPPTSRGRASCSPCRSAANSKIPQRPRRPTNPACYHDRAPAAAGACSSSRPSCAAASQGTDQRPRRPRSGSTPHDAVIADPAPHRSAPFCPPLARQHSRLRGSARRDRTTNPVEQCAIRSLAPARPPKIELKQSDRQRWPNLPNTHADAKSPSTRCIVGAPHPAILCLGAFQTPAVRACGWSRHCRCPKNRTSAATRQAMDTIKDG